MKKLINLSISFILVFFLAACSGSSKPRMTYDVVLTDFSFSPSQYIVPAGQEITLDLVNNGVVVHDFIIFNLGTEAGDHFDEEDFPNIYWQVKVEHGESVTATFTAPTEPGEYFVTCGIAGHLESGMVGKLIVVEGE